MKGNVLICDLDDDKGNAIVRELGNSVLYCKTNVCDEISVEKSLDACINKFGSLHGIFNCAGIATPRRVLSSSGKVHPYAPFMNVLNVNVGGTFNVIRLAAARIAKQPAYNASGERGVIVNVASVAAFEGQIGQAAYSASKGAIVSMTLPIAREFSKLGIRINTVAPGIFGTPLLRALPKPAQDSLSKQVPFPSRLGEPSEFADLCVHIVENGYINGEVIRIDGSIRMSAL